MNTLYIQIEHNVLTGKLLFQVALSHAHFCRLFIGRNERKILKQNALIKENTGDSICNENTF